MELKAGVSNQGIHNNKYYIFCTLWCIYYITIFLDNTALYVLYQNDVVASIIKVVRYLVYYGLILLIVSRKRVSFKLMIGALLCTIVFGMQSVTINSNVFISLLLFALAASEYKSVDIIKCTMTIETVLMIMTIITSMFFSNLAVVVYETDRDVTRNLLGFAWAFHAPNLLLFVYLQFIYIKKNNIKLVEMLFFEFFSTILLILTKTRTPFIIITVSTIVTLAVKNLKFFNKFIGKLQLIIKCLPFIACFLSLFLTIQYRNISFLSELNVILHDRLWLANRAYNQYGVTLFGQEVRWIGSQYLTKTNFEYNFVDNAYIQMLVKNGVFLTIFTLITYHLMIKKSLKTKEYYFVFILAFLCIYGLINPCLLDLTMNPFILLLFTETSGIIGKRIKLRIVR